MLSWISSSLYGEEEDSSLEKKDPNNIFDQDDSEIAVLLKENPLKLEEVKEMGIKLKKAAATTNGSSNGTVKDYYTHSSDDKETALAIRLNANFDAVAKLRFQLVPKKIKEDIFWKAIFALLQNRLKKDVDKKDDDGFRGKAKATNKADVDCNKIPMVPRNGKILLLDIEGCTTSIAFVKEILFPYVTENIESYLKPLSEAELTAIHSGLTADIEKLPSNHPCRNITQYWGEKTRSKVVKLVKALVASDVKATALKSLQGKMWKSGYENGTIKGHLYPDFIPLLMWCEEQNIRVYIYSSGSIEAQKLLFGHSISGDITRYFKGYFDTTSGGKKEGQSYRNIAKSIGVYPSYITFVSDSEAELVAAKEGGICNAVMSIRPGNAPLTPVADQFPAIHSLLQLCGD